MKQLRNNQYSFLVIASAALLLILPATGRADVAVPNTFTSGTTISSSQVNANFSTLANAMPGVKKTVAQGIHVITSTTGALVSLAVTPPTDGQVIVIGTGTITFLQESPVHNAAQFSLNTTAGTLKSPVIAHAFGPYSNSAPGVGQLVAGSLNIVDVFPVTGGVTTTIYLNANRDSTGVNKLQAEYPGLTAIFVPNTLP